MIKCLKLSFELVLTLCIMMFGGCAEVDKNGENTGSAVAGDFTVPEYTSGAYEVVNDNVPYFTEDEYTTEAFESYSELDGLNRCGVAFACIGEEIMPTEERGAIGQVKPSGWHTVKYDCVEGKYLYNRCHLIGFQLSGENANEKNLITGTRYMNTEGMLPFENMVADYVKETNNHVMYRVTPVFEDENLVAAGVLMEAYSVEDKGEGICFNVFCYNVQPGIEIDYATGESYEKGDSAENNTVSNGTVTQDTNSGNNAEEKADSANYIGNKNSKKFHVPSCGSVSSMNESNKVYLTCSRDEAIDMGYEPCGRCNP